jgi:5,5'-dehydrodivanillate O-demethylase oxygenase subunit
MLSEKKNRILTQVRSGTPMGELLRRYWHPLAALAELRARTVLPVRILGEDLVLFRSRDGHNGLTERHCPHRGADLSYGWIDDYGLRCSYHGWAFGPDGACTAQAFEEAPPADGFRPQVAITSYPTAELGGLVWGYLGTLPAPLVPDFETFHWDRGFTEIIISTLPCNWFQCHENGVDPVHFEWLHTNWTSVQSSPAPIRYGQRHEALSFVEFDHGFVSGRQVSDWDPTVPGPKIVPGPATEGGILCLWPYTLVTGFTMEWRVPVDDTTTLNITRQYSPLPDDMPALAPDDVPYWYAPIHDEQTGRLITTHAMNQDFAAWIGQGTIADRTREHLGRADRGITMLRRRYLDEAARVMQGLDPPGTIREAHENSSIPLPILARHKQRLVHGMSRPDLQKQFAARQALGYATDGFPSVQAGRPEAIRQLYEKAMGGPFVDLAGSPPAADAAQAEQHRPSRTTAR